MSEACINKIELDAETLSQSRALVAHEAAHVLVSEKLGMPVERIELAIYDDGKQSGTVVRRGSVNANKDELATAFAAGFAGELVVLGEVEMQKRGFKGFAHDSKQMNRLGYKTQDQKVALVKKAMEIIERNKEEYAHLVAQLHEAFKEQLMLGRNSYTTERIVH
jgi:hypothetical protein